MRGFFFSAPGKQLRKLEQGQGTLSAPGRGKGRGTSSGAGAGMVILDFEPCAIPAAAYLALTIVLIRLG
jgi:hypothetical protein